MGNMQAALGLQITLASQVTNLQTFLSFPVPISVSIRNTAETPVTLLTWNTPLDLQAGVLGVFEVYDTGNGQSIPIDTIKISRKLPATPEDLVEIPAGETVNRIVKIPEFQFEDGHEYSIRAQGIWHAIWEIPLTEVTTSQLSDLTGSTREEFQSNIALINAG